MAPPDDIVAPQSRANPHARGTDEIIESHPAYAEISISEISGNRHDVLYGSPLEHPRHIRLTLHKSELYRSASMSTDRPSPGAPLAEVSLSLTQWASLLSSVNGMSTQCTLRQFDGEAIPRLPAPADLRTRFQESLEGRLDHALAGLAALEKKVAEASLSAKAKSELTGQIDVIRAELGRNLEYVGRRFDEHMAGATAEARANLQAAFKALVPPEQQTSLQPHFAQNLLLDSPQGQDDPESARVARNRQKP
jgi:hypothetical protein